MDAVALLGRILLGAIFVGAGYGKLMDPAGTTAMLGRAGLPIPDIAYWVAVVVELGGGALFILGVKPRWVAVVLAG
jgi:putative oxidoreductase